MKKIFSLSIIFSLLFSMNVSAQTIQNSDEASLNIPLNPMSETMVEYDLISGERSQETYSLTNMYTNSMQFLPQPLSTSAIIGEDDREPGDVMDSAIGLIHMVKPDGTYVGTGTLVSEDLVLTAAHNVYSEAHGRASSMTFTAGIDPNGDHYGTCVATAAYLPMTWENTFDPGFDWAFLRLSEPLGNSCGYYACEIVDNPVGKTAFITGYPTDLVNDYGGYIQVYSESPVIAKSDYLMHYTADTFGGQSGSPIFNLDYNTFEFKIMGIHSEGNAILGVGYNSGVRVNSLILDILDIYSN